MPDNFPSGSVIRRVNLEPAIFLGAGRALLLQLAHPAVAQGVHDHSDFKRNPFKRLQGTLESTLAVVYGSEELAEGVGRRIRWIHDFVVGPTYAANDPENLLWVHATLLDTALRCHTDFVGPLDDDDAETYYRQMCRCNDVFGIPPELHPPSLADFRAYFDATVAGLTVTDVGRDLSAFILDPELPLRLDVPLRPAVRLQRLVTIGTLPSPIREQLGLPWTRRDADRLARHRRRIRRVLTTAPYAVRTAGPRAGVQVLVRQAARRVADWERQLAAAPASSST